MRFVRTLAALAALVVVVAPAHATTYTPGEFVTFEANVWGVPADGFNAASLLENNFDTVFPQIPQPSAGSGPYLAVGITDAQTLIGGADPSLPFSLILSGSGGIDVQQFLANATINPVLFVAPSFLSGNFNDFFNSNVFGDPGGLLSADAIALTLNVDYSDHGLLAHPAGVPFGDLVFQNLDSLVGQLVTLPEGDFGPFPLGSDAASLDGLSVRDVLSEANLLLSGEGVPSPLSPGDLDYVLSLANTAFNEGLLNESAQFLALPMWPDRGDGASTVPEPSTWAMLLIGFAGLGLAGLRGRRRGEAV